MEIMLSVQEMTEKNLADLEERNLIQRFMPADRIVNAAPGTVEVDRVYETDPKFGSHMLICAGFNKSTVELAYHSDREDFLLINEGRDQKPLILIVALRSVEELETLVSKQELKADDFLALELKFNDPRLSFFTMNSFTVHCEWTAPGPELANVFYVTEPSQLDMQPVSLGDYSIRIIHEGSTKG